MDRTVLLIRIYKEGLWTFKIMMWALAPHNAIETNKISGDVMGIPHGAVAARGSPQRRGRGSGTLAPPLAPLQPIAPVVSACLALPIFIAQSAHYGREYRSAHSPRQPRRHRRLARILHRRSFYGNIN